MNVTGVHAQRHKYPLGTCRIEGPVCINQRSVQVENISVVHRLGPPKFS